MEKTSTYTVSGIFVIKAEADNCREAITKVERILQCSGIDGLVIDVELEESLENLV